MRKTSLLKVLDNNLLVIILFIFIGFLLYAYTLKGAFLHMDDLDGIVNNPRVVEITLAIKHLELQNTVNAVIFKQFGANPAPFHFLSIMLHVVNTIYIFFLSKLLFNRKLALFSSLLFLIHPANSEVVSWITGIAYLYQALFWLSVTYLYILYRKTSNIIFLISSAVIYILYFILLGGVWGLVLPFVLFTLDYFVLNKKYTIRKALPVAIFAVTAATYLVISFTNEYSLRSDDLEYYYVGLTSQNRVVSMLRVVDNSVKLFVIPYRLSILFGNFDRSALGYFGLLISLSFLLYTFYYFYKRNRVYFGLLILIYVSVLPLFSPISIGLGYAERYFYFSSVFFSIFAAALILDFYKKTRKKEVLLPILILIFTLLSLRTFIRTLDWKNDETIWRAALATDSENNYKAYNELGNVYYRNNQLREALIEYEKALEIRPKYPEVLHNVGLTYIKAGQLDNAKIFMQRSLQLNPNLYESYYRLGQVYSYEKNFEQAKIFFTQALKIKPDFLPAQKELTKLSDN